MELQNITDDTMCWSMTHIQMCGYFIHSYAAIFLQDGFNCCNGLWCHYSVCLTWSRTVCYRTNAVHELPSPLRTLAVVTDMHHHTELSFVDEFRCVSPFHYLKKRMTERCSSLVHVTSGAAIFTLLLRRRIVFLCRTATCRPLFKPSVSLSSTYKTMELWFEFISHFLRFSFESP